MTTINVFFPQIRALFSHFWKRAGDTCPPLPPLVTRLVSIKKEYKVKTKKGLTRKLFEQHSKETAVVFLNVKLLPETIYTSCLYPGCKLVVLVVYWLVGSIHDHPSQREHDCLMMDKGESVNMNFEEIVKKFDF